MTYYSKITSQANKIKPENIYLIIALIYGVLFIFTTPPFQVPDEIGHFYRSYQISDGQMVASVKERWIGGYFPKSLILTHRAAINKPGRIPLPLINMPLNDKDRTFSANICMSFYSPVPYIPQVIGIGLGRILDTSPLKLMYMGRFMNLMTSIAIVYLAIKITPIQKWLFFLLTLTPMFLFLSASLSADAFTNAVCVLWVSVILRYSLSQKKVGKSDIALLIFLAAVISLSKQAYMPLSLLFLLIKPESFGNKKSYLMSMFLLFAGSLLATLFWAYTITPLVDVHFTSWKYNLSPDKKISFLTTEPLQFLGIIMNHFKSGGLGYIEHLVGRLGILDVYLPKWLIVSYIGMIFVTTMNFTSSNEFQVNIKKKFIILFSILSCIVLIFTSLYIMYSTMTNNLIGVHGRYFIPVSIPFLLLFHGVKMRFKIEQLNLFIMFFTVISLSCALLALYKKYYSV